MFGFLALSVGTGLFDALILLSPLAFLWVWVTIAFAFGTLTSARNTIFPHIFAGRDFQKVFRRYRGFVIWSYALAITLATFGLAFLYVPGVKWLSGGLVLGGLSYFLMVPAFTTSRIFKPNNEARLSILQFLRERNTGDPDYSWLRKGLRRVERNLPRFGISIPTDSLFLGCSYRILKGIGVETDLIPISDWVLNPTDRPVSAITRFLLSAEDARALGMSQPQGFRDSLRKLPWGHIIVLVAVILGALLELLTSIIRKALGLS